VFNDPFVFLENHFINRPGCAIKYMFYTACKKRFFCGKNGDKSEKYVIVACRGIFGGISDLYKPQ